LLGLAVALVVSGGASGVLAGLVVAGLALAVLAAALVMTHAPVSIANLLGDDEPSDEPSPPGEGQPPGRNGGPREG
jgi:hypothetical protein